MSLASRDQRTRNTAADGSYWSYEYDSLGQVKSGKKYWADNTPVAGQQFEYTHDDIGNRAATKAGGDQTGAGLRAANYSANSLNQYTSRDLPGAVDVMGIAFATATVTVNSQAPYRKGEYFRKELSVANGSAPVWQSVSVGATGETTANGNVFVPKIPEAFTPDLDGNLLTDGRWTYTWDAENRLIKVESLTSGPTASRRKVVWEYDCRGRRIRQTTYNGSSGTYLVTEDLKFVSDGWRHIAELNAANNSLLRSYVWGLDLSGSFDGAGGVRGLLMVNSAANGSHFYGYDGNGNVAALVKGTDGTISARYEYGPFGETLRNTGSMANENRFQFSTKRTDRTTELVLFEYRAYGPAPGRWLNADPSQERGGLNLFEFANNEPVNAIDDFGLGVIYMGPKDGRGGTVIVTPAQPQAQTTGEKIRSWVVPNPKETIKQADKAFETAANPDLPTHARISAGVAGTCIVILGVIECVPGSGGGTKPIKSKCANLAEEAIEKGVNKAVNSELPHAAANAAERGVFATQREAAEALRELSRTITSGGKLPPGTIVDTAHLDRVLVPVGKDGYAVYQIAQNGTAKLKTVLIKR